MTPPRPKPLYSLPPPNGDLFEWGGTLRNLRHGKPGPGGHPVPVGAVVHAKEGPLGAPYSWLEADWFEALLAEDPLVQGLVLQCLRKLGQEKPVDGTRAQAVEAVRRVFLDQYLERIRAYFEAAVPLLADYVIAKAAHARVAPPEQPDLPGSHQ